jgi:hypothetical protein
MDFADLQLADQVQPAFLPADGVHEERQGRAKLA